MATKYPDQIDGNNELPQVINNVTPVIAEVVNNLRGAIIAIEQELGADPSREYGTVRTRLDAMQDSLNALIAGGAGISAVKQDNTTVVTNATSLNFTGTGVTVTSSGSQANIAINGGGDQAVQVQQSIAVVANNQTSFTLSNIPANSAAVMMFVNGAKQDYGTDYFVSSSAVTYTGPPSLLTTDIVEFWYLVSGSISPGGADLTIQEEGGNIDTATTLINFIGTGITATSAGSGLVNVTLAVNVTESTDDIIVVTPTAGNYNLTSPHLRITSSQGVAFGINTPSSAAVTAVGVFIGLNAGSSRTGGSSNVAVGQGALNNAGSGSDNVAVGSSAGASNTGSNNTAVGPNANVIGALTDAISIGSSTSAVSNRQIIIGTGITGAASTNGYITIGDAFTAVGLASSSKGAINGRHSVASGLGLVSQSAIWGIYASNTASNTLSTPLIVMDNTDGLAGGSRIQMFQGQTAPIGNITGNPGDIYFRSDTASSVPYYHTGASANNTSWTTFGSLPAQAALTVVANATNGVASPTAVAAATDGHVFRRSGTALGFGQIVTAGVADQTITLPKLANGSASGQSFTWDGSAWTLIGILTATNLTDANLSRSISDGARFVLPNATLTAARTLTLAATGSPILGETIYVERYDTTANIYTVVDAVSALTIFVFPVTIRRSASFRWNGTNWTNTESSIRLT